jgi:hypothetical protein
MALIYEVPTHLNAEDTLIFGLTPRQLLRISVGASLAYVVWDQASPLVDGWRIALTGAFVLFGVLLGLCQPAGRPLDQWLLAAILFSTLPRRRVWRLIIAALGTTTSVALLIGQSCRRSPRGFDRPPPIYAQIMISPAMAEGCTAGGRGECGHAGQPGSHGARGGYRSIRCRRAHTRGCCSRCRRCRRIACRGG